MGKESIEKKVGPEERGPVFSEFANNRIVKFGELLTKAATYLSLSRHVMSIVLVGAFALLACVHPALAQGPITGSNPQSPINMVRTLITVLTWLMIAGGIGAIAFGIYRGYRGQGWGAPVTWGAISLGFGGFVAFFNDIANDGTPELPEF